MKTTDRDWLLEDLSFRTMIHSSSRAWTEDPAYTILLESSDLLTWAITKLITYTPARDRDPTVTWSPWILITLLGDCLRAHGLEVPIKRGHEGRLYEIINDYRTSKYNSTVQ